MCTKQSSEKIGRTAGCRSLQNPPRAICPWHPRTLRRRQQQQRCCLSSVSYHTIQLPAAPLVQTRRLLFHSSQHLPTMAQGMHAADDVPLSRNAAVAASPGLELPDQQPRRRRRRWWWCLGSYGCVLSWVPCLPGCSNVAERAVSRFPKDSMFAGCGPRRRRRDEGPVLQAPPAAERDASLEKGGEHKHDVPSTGSHGDDGGAPPSSDSAIVGG